METPCDYLPKWLDCSHRMACQSKSWEYQNAACLMTVWRRSSTKSYSWPTLKPSFSIIILATCLPDDAGAHPWLSGDEKWNQVRGSCSSDFNWNNLGPSQAPQPREQNWLIWPRLSCGEKKSLYTWTINQYSFTTRHIHEMICKKEGFSLLGKRTLKHLGLPRGYLASPMNCCSPLPGCWPAFFWWHTMTWCCLRLHGKEELDSSDPQGDGGHQRERSFSQKQLAFPRLLNWGP